MSEKQNQEFEWDKDACKECDVCQKLCPPGGLKLEEGELDRNAEKCNLCGLCAMYCPDGAIQVQKDINK
ncbi:4Fe-4S binding protein [Patescibacteria group bacterium]